jgi:hypothetical protein
MSLDANNNKPERKQVQVVIEEAAGERVRQLVISPAVYGLSSSLSSGPNVLSSQNHLRCCDGFTTLSQHILKHRLVQLNSATNCFKLPASSAHCSFVPRMRTSVDAVAPVGPGVQGISGRRSMVLWSRCISLEKPRFSSVLSTWLTVR